MFFKASSNTRILDYPRTIDNKQDIDKLVQDVLKGNLVDKLVSKSIDSGWKFY